MKPKNIIQQLLKWRGQTYASELGIELIHQDKAEIFKWFLAAILFGARISENIAKNTFFQFEKNKLTTPQTIVNAGWDRLVEVLDAGGYVRYDFKIADKLLEVMQNLLQNYQGDLNLLHEQSQNPQDLTKRIQALGKGIGPITVQIFLRELRGIWNNARQPLSSFAFLCAQNLALIEQDIADNERVMNELQEIWYKSNKNLLEFSRFETALLRVGKEYCRKNRCALCQLNKVCQKANPNA